MFVRRRALPTVAVHVDEELVRELAREMGERLGVVVDVDVDRLGARPFSL